jgi:hypothetical protein
MSTSCSRKRSYQEPLAAADDTFQEWFLVTLPEETADRNDTAASGRRAGRLWSLSRAQGRWIRARLKIKLLRRFRTLWTESWLNLHSEGTVDRKVRDTAAHVWAASGKAILIRFNTSDLFLPLIRIERRRTAGPRQNTGGRPSGAAVR